MPKSTQPAAAFPAQPPVRVIPPDALMRLDELRAVLGLPLTCLRREARLGRLRVEYENERKSPASGLKVADEQAGNGEERNDRRFRYRL